MSISLKGFLFLWWYLIFKVDEMGVVPLLSETQEKHENLQEVIDQTRREMAERKLCRVWTCQSEWWPRRPSPTSSRGGCGSWSSWCSQERLTSPASMAKRKKGAIILDKDGPSSLFIFSTTNPIRYSFISIRNEIEKEKKSHLLVMY